MSITGWSPAGPYLGDTITISGAGFSTIPAENLVKLASCAPACSAASPFAMTVLASTSTQLTVVVPWNYPSGLKPAAARLKVLVNGDSAVTQDTVHFKFPPVILSMTNLDFGAAPGYAVRGGDRIRLSVWGVLPTAAQMALTVNGDAAPIDSVIAPANGLEGGGAIFARFPTVIYPAGYQPTDIINDTAFVLLRFSARGRSDTLTYRAWRYPRSEFHQSVGGTYASGVNHPAVATGVNMPGPFAVVFAATDTIRQSRTVGLAGCEPLCDEVHFTIPGDLEPGGFFVHLKLLSLVGEPLVNVGQIAIQ